MSFVISSSRTSGPSAMRTRNRSTLGAGSEPFPTSRDTSGPCARRPERSPWCPNRDAGPGSPTNGPNVRTPKPRSRTKSVADRRYPKAVPHGGSWISQFHDANGSIQGRGEARPVKRAGHGFCTDARRTHPKRGQRRRGGGAGRLSRHHLHGYGEPAPPEIRALETRTGTGTGSRSWASVEVPEKCSRSPTRIAC
jgi:hypothetical protein